VSEEAKVAARLMGEWEKDPFTQEVDLDSRYPDCPFRMHWNGCRAAKVKGTRKEWIYLTCPTMFRGKSIGAPEKCPLRCDGIVIKGVSKSGE
jgi:hypothetical protein